MISSGAKRFLRVAAASGALIVAVAGCSSSKSNNSGSGGGGTAANSTSSVRFLSYVGTTAWLAYVADQQGIFAKNHIKPVFTSLPAGTQAINAMLGGALDVAIFDPNNAAPLISSGQNIKMLYPELYNYWSLLTDKSHAKPSLGAFVQSQKGKQVAAPSVGGGGGLEYLYLAKQYGLQKSDTKLVADLSGAALLTGRVQAYMSDPGLGCSLVGQGAVLQTNFQQKPADFSTMPAGVQKLYNLPSLAYWVYGSWADKHPTEVKNLQTALGEAIDYITAPANLSAVVKTLRASKYNYPKLSDAQFTSCVQTLVKGFEKTFSQSDWQTWSQIVQDEGVSPSGLPDMSKYLVTGFPTS